MTKKLNNRDPLRPIWYLFEQELNSFVHMVDWVFNYFAQSLIIYSAGERWNMVIIPCLDTNKISFPSMLEWYNISMLVPMSVSVEVYGSK